VADVFERAWGNYLAMMEFLTNPSGEAGGFDEQRGLLQLYNFASLLTYSDDAPNYNDFLLQNAIDFVAPGTPTAVNGDDLEERTRIEHSLKLSENYNHFLNVLDVLLENAIDPASLEAYKPYEKAVFTALTSLQNYNSFVNSEWRDWVIDNPGFPVDQLPDQRIIWERDFGHSMELATRRKSLKHAHNRRNAWLRLNTPAEVHSIMEARTYFDDPNHRVKLPVSANHEDRRAYWQEFHLQLPTINIADFLKNDDLIEKSFSSEEEHYKRVETKWKVKVKSKWGIFKGSGSAQRRKLEELSKKTAFAVEVKMTKFQEVEVFRSRWFQPILFDTVGKSFPEFWGPGGMLATYPVSLLICRGLSIKVKVDEEYKKTLEKYFKAGGRASFGPFFSGGGSYSKDEKYMDFKVTSDGFQLTDNAKTIRLLGCRVRRPNWDDNGEEYIKGMNLDGLSSANDYFKSLNP